MLFTGYLFFHHFPDSHHEATTAADMAMGTLAKGPSITNTCLMTKILRPLLESTQHYSQQISEGDRVHTTSPSSHN